MLPQNETKNKTSEPLSECPEGVGNVAIAVGSISSFVAMLLSYWHLILEFTKVVWKSLLNEDKSAISRYLHFGNHNVLTIFMFCGFEVNGWPG